MCEAEYAAVAGSTRGKEDSTLVSNHTTAPHWANLMNTFEVCSKSSTCFAWAPLELERTLSASHDFQAGKRRRARTAQM